MVCDLLIIGGGPAGLSAAINGASEGLKVRLIDNGSMLGGQARESSAIENYPGFPEGISGNDLMSRIVRQAHKFDTGLLCPVTAAQLQAGDDGLWVVRTDDYHEIETRTVILSIGLSYRRLDADNIGQFLGRGVHYGVPATPHSGRHDTILIVGGANSAGQAAMALARNSHSRIKLIVRRTLEAQMSAYLIQRIRACPRIEVCENCEVIGVTGKNALQEAAVSTPDGLRFMPATALYIFIGAVPRTLWLQNSGLAMDPKRFICTGQEVEGTPPSFCTNLPGVFAAGDVRAGNATKRIASAVGEGVGALQAVHKYLAGRE